MTANPAVAIATHEDIRPHGRSALALEWLGRFHCEHPILDVGCAWGYVTRRIPGNGPVVGVEFDSNFVREAKKRDARTAYVNASAWRLPFSAGTFRTGLLLDVLEHVESDAACISELARVLAPGGKLIISVPHDSWLPNIMDRGFRKGHRYYSLPRLQQLTSAYFRLVHVLRGGFWLNMTDRYFCAVADRIDRLAGQPHCRTFLRIFLDPITDGEYRIPLGRMSHSLIGLLERSGAARDGG